MAVTYSAEQVDELLKCPICLDRFKNPRSLPCQHTFCAEPCLRNLATVATVRCPECRAVHSLPPGGVTAFPPNVTISHFLELRETTTSTTREPACGVCNATGPLSRCEHCDQMLCSACELAHLAQLKASAQKEVAQLRRSLPRYNARTMECAAQMEELTQQADKLKGEIRSSFEVILRALRERQQYLEAQVDMHMEAPKIDIQLLQENLEMEIATASSYCDTSETQLNSSPEIPVLREIIRQCQNHTSQLRHANDGHFEAPNLVYHAAAVNSAIRELGHVTTTSNHSAITPRVAEQHPQHSIQRTDYYAMHNARLRNRESQPPVPSLSPRGNIDNYMFPSNAMNMHQTVVSNSTNQRPGNRTNASSVFGPEATPSLRRNAHDDVPVGMANPYADAFGQPMTSSRPEVAENSNSRSVAFDVVLNTENSDANAVATLPPVATNAANRSDNRGRRRGAENTEGGARRNQNITAVNQDHVETSAPPISAPRARTFVVDPENAADNERIHFTLSHAIGRGRGNGRDLFSCPRGVAVNQTDGTIFVADSSNNRVVLYDGNGRFLSYYGSNGRGDGEFDSMAGIAVNPMNQMIVVDRYNTRIQVIDRDGRFSHQFGSEGGGSGELRSPWGVATDRSGFIYVCDRDNHRLQVFQQNGSFVRKFGQRGNGDKKLESPKYCAVYDDRLIVADAGNNRLQLFSLTGRHCHVIQLGDGHFRQPLGVAVTQDGVIFCCEAGRKRVVAINMRGEILGIVGNQDGCSEMQCPEGIALTPNETIVVTDSVANKLFIFAIR